MSCELEDNLEIWAGLDINYGDRNGLFGQFDDNNKLLMGAEIGL